MHACVVSRFSFVWLFAIPGSRPPGSSVLGILQARVLEWVATPSSRGSFQPRDQTLSFIAGRYFSDWARPPCPSPTPRVHSDSHPSSHWCHPAISSSVVPFSSSLQSFPASRSFPVSQFFASGGQSIGAPASASVLPMNIQDWLLLGWIGWISLQSKGLSRVFSNTTVQKHQFLSTQLSL